MADSKITALAALTTADPANDMFPVVDVSDTSMAASGTTKRISINNILACSPSATLASATITGAATVGTTLGVTGVSTFAAGTALLPALTTTGDTNTGIYYPAADTFAVTTGGTERYRVDSTGNIGIGVTPAGTGGCLQLKSGVTFPATQVASSDANTLDDYEEGTWTIGLTFGGGSTGITTSSNTGRYTKIGRQVTVVGRLKLTSKGSSTGSAVITGLPFTIALGDQSYSAASFRISDITYTGIVQSLGIINTTTFNFEQLSTAGTASALTDTNFSNSSDVVFSLTYTV